MKYILAGDDRVKIDVVEHMSPSSISPFDNDDPAFQIVCNSILEVYPKSAVIPTLLIGQTDGKHYEWICNKIYRFTPSYINKREGQMYHGVDERISVDDFANVVQFYYRLISNAAFNLEIKILGSRAGGKNEDADGTVTLFGQKVAIPDIFTRDREEEKLGGSSESPIGEASNSQDGEGERARDENGDDGEDIEEEGGDGDDDGGGVTVFGHKIDIFGSSDSKEEDLAPEEQ